MANISVCAFFMLLALAIAVQEVHASIAQDPLSVEKWFEELPEMKEKVTKLHFFFHDRIVGTNPTAFVVAQVNTTSPLPNNFGIVLMADEPLTVGPDPNSTEIGRAQGMYGQAALDEISFFMDFNLVFTKGKYNGSTLSLVGRNPIGHEFRELSIVGGSGVFRLARGIATANTFSTISINAIVEYHVVVLHY